MRRSPAYGAFVLAALIGLVCGASSIPLPAWAGSFAGSPFEGSPPTTDTSGLVSKSGDTISGTLTSSVAANSCAFTVQSSARICNVGGTPNLYPDGTGWNFGGYMIGPTIQVNNVVAAVYVNFSTPTALPTCNAGAEGKIYRVSATGGTSTTKRTKICLCTSDGAASPAYAWQNVITGTMSGTPTTTCGTE